MPNFDFTINVADLLTFGGAAIGLLWKASQFVAEMKAFRQRFETHAAEDTEHFEQVGTRFERVETRLEDLRQFAIGRRSS
jgi:hypothetical protein